MVYKHTQNIKISFIIGFILTAKIAQAMFGEYKPISKSEIRSLPEWISKIPRFRSVLDSITNKYRESSKLIIINKHMTPGFNTNVSQVIFGPSGMTQLVLDFHEVLMSPGVLQSQFGSFVDDPEELELFRGEISDIISTLETFQAYGSDPTAATTGISVAPILHSLLTIYAKKSSVFQKYPLYSTSTLLPLTQYIVTAATLDYDRFPAAHKKLMCRLRGVWKLYEKLGITSRLEMVQVFSWVESDYSHRVQIDPLCTVKTCPDGLLQSNTSPEIFLVTNSDFNLKGYNLRGRNFTAPLDVYWARDKCSVKEKVYWRKWLETNKPSNQGLFCMSDPLIGGTLITFSKEKDHFISPSVKEYFGTLRQIIEVEFKRISNSIESLKSQPSLCHSSPTGSIAVTVVRAELVLETNSPYDQADWIAVTGLRFPDTYVKILVDDEEIGRTSIENNTLLPIWLETFQSDNVFAWSDLKVEVYDSHHNVVGMNKGPDKLLGGVELELLNIVGDTHAFSSMRSNFAVGKITFSVMYNPLKNLHYLD